MSDLEEFCYGLGEIIALAEHEKRAYSTDNPCHRIWQFVADRLRIDRAAAVSAGIRICEHPVCTKKGYKGGLVGVLPEHA